MKYNRIMPGAKSVHLNDFLDGEFIGVDFGIDKDLSDDVKHFKDKYRPAYLETRPFSSLKELHPIL